MKRYPLFFQWSTIRGLFLLLPTAIFLGGLLYNRNISTLNSKNLTEVQEKANPILEKTTLLKLKLRSIQDRFYDAVALANESKLSQLNADRTEFLDLVTELDRLAGDRERLRSIRSIFNEYLPLGERISRTLIRNNNETSPIEQSLVEFSENGKILAGTIEKLSAESQENFKAVMRRSAQDSAMMLRVSLWSSIAGVILIGGISTLILNLNQRLARANENLEGQVKVRTRELESFVYTVSHDLKSPIVSMHGMASILQQKHGDVLGEKGKHYLERIISNSRFMEELITGLLVISQIGRKQANVEFADFKSVLEQILDMQKDLLQEKKIEVAIRPPLPHFIFDRTHLSQLLQNLITNAAKFMGDQPRPRIEIGGRESKEWIEFYVRDNGIGIDPAYHEKVFGVFQRLQEVNVKGTGVGLSIVKKIVDLAGGTIRIESKKGEGAMFIIRLPREERKKDEKNLAKN